MRCTCGWFMDGYKSMGPGKALEDVAVNGGVLGLGLGLEALEDVAVDNGILHPEPWRLGQEELRHNHAERKDVHRWRHLGVRLRVRR